MGGRIWLESPDQGGSIFHCVLRLGPVTGSAPLIETPREDQPIKGLSILLVDDNDLNRDVARMALDQDHRVVTANNGIEALQALAGESFDLVLMDVQMPEMDGLTATIVLRAIEQGMPPPVSLGDGLQDRLAPALRGGHLPVVAMTAHALRDDEDRYRTAGMDAYVSKPFNIRGLNAAMRSALMRVRGSAMV